MKTVTEFAHNLVEEPSVQTAEIFINSLKDRNGLFEAQEDTRHDYKDLFPFSMTDGYFAGIVRLVFAFHNSLGGIIVFGVHDTKKTAGHNKVKINIETFNNRLRDLSGFSINLQYLTIGENDERVDLIVVPKRAVNKPPVCLQANLDKYFKGTVWLRNGHEVLEAESKDIRYLFSSRDDVDLDSDSNKSTNIPYQMQPSPAFVKSFIGRFELLSELMTWVVETDEPRKYLYGDGGSGKSTAAYEFARLVRDNGKILRIFEGNYFDRVIYLSAKEKSLNSATAEIVDEKTTDFSNLTELLVSICEACGYSDDIDVSNLNQSALETCVKEIFDYENILIVIDDIDTLTTKKIDAGSDLIFKWCIKASCDVRILYTQRNPPAEIQNAIGVSGFKLDKEYSEFISKCCKIFDVPIPSETSTLDDLKNESDGIPLIIETIIGLRKSCGSYKNALEAFKERKGSEARKYLFEREYDSLPTDSNAKNILSIIAQFNKPVSNDDICRISMIGDDAVSNNIAVLLGFFVSSLVTESGETRYYLNSVTNQYVKEKSKKLNFYPKSVERVKAFKSGIMKKPKELINLERDFEKLESRNNLLEIKTLFEQEFGAKLTEHPEFRILRAKAYLKLSPPKTFEAREDFEFCLKMKHEDAASMRLWLRMEKDNNSSTLDQRKICDHVINGKSYADEIKHEFLSKRAAIYYFSAQSESGVDDYNSLEKALSDSAKAFNFFAKNNSNGPKIAINFRNTAYSLIQSGLRLNYDSEIAKLFRKIHDEIGIFDSPLFEPFRNFILKLSENGTNENKKTKVGILAHFRSDFNNGKLKFCEPKHNDEIKLLLKK